MGMAPKEADIVDFIPPSYFGGNMDNWRVGKGATMYYPVAVPGGLFSIGDLEDVGRTKAVQPLNFPGLSAARLLTNLVSRKGA